MQIELVPTIALRHIEGFSERRVDWLVAKILSEDAWNKPIALDTRHNLVLDGQHRMEAASRLGLRVVPAVRFEYASVEVWSLRPQYSFTWQDVEARALSGDIYPYKTVKHAWSEPLPKVRYALEDLR